MVSGAQAWRCHQRSWSEAAEQESFYRCCYWGLVFLQCTGYIGRVHALLAVEPLHEYVPVNIGVENGKMGCREERDI